MQLGRDLEQIEQWTKRPLIRRDQQEEYQKELKKLRGRLARLQEHWETSSALDAFTPNQPSLLSEVFHSIYDSQPDIEKAQELVAYVGGVRDVRAVDRWMKGSELYGDAEQGLRFAFQLVRVLAEKEDPTVIQSWLTGLNPELGDRVPLRLMRENDLEIGQERSFLRFPSDHWEQV